MPVDAPVVARVVLKKPGFKSPIYLTKKYLFKTIILEAEEWRGERLSSEEFNEEAKGSCSVYRECCSKQCHPRELGPEEC